MTDTDDFANSSSLLKLAAIAVVVAALHFAKGVLVPFILGVLVSFSLSPVCSWLEHRRIARIPSVVITGTCAFLVLSVIAWTAAVQMADLTVKLPEYQENIQAKIQGAQAYVHRSLRRVTRTAEEIGQTLTQQEQTVEPKGRTERPYPIRIVSTPPGPVQLFSGMFGTLLEVLASAGVVIVLAIFFLIRRNDLRDRFIRLIGKGQVTVTTQALEDASTRVSRYLLTQIFINFSCGMFVALGLYLIGIPNAILWGILTATLRFIPYIGAWISAAMPIGLSLAASSGWEKPAMTIAFFVVLELVVNNVIEPWLYGRNTGVSPVAVLVAAVFWTWLWGGIGLLLATPCTVCLMVVGRYVPQLSFLHVMLGDEEVFEPKTRIYQRLLAGDQEEAAELIEDYLQQRTVSELYDEVLIPALAMVETHWRRGEITDSRHDFILQTLSETVEELGETLAETDPLADETTFRDREASLSRCCIVCLPAHGPADELSQLMLAQLLSEEGYSVQAVSSVVLVGEMADLIAASQADVVCISAMPPSAQTHARRLCKRLRTRLPNVDLVVGLWNARSDPRRSKTRVGQGEQTHIVNTLAEALRCVNGLRPALPQESHVADAASVRHEVANLARDWAVTVLPSSGEIGCAADE